ncbi:unnamed protein product [Closterium sp. NIES-53]
MTCTQNDVHPTLSAFATVEDLVSHLRTSDARYRAALPAEFLDTNPPPMYITLYFIVTRLPDSLRAVRPGDRATVRPCDRATGRHGAEGDCYLCVLPDPGIEAAALGASESALSGTAPAEALHTFMLDLGAFRCFFRPVAPPSSCRFLSYQTLLWLHRLGHPSLPCLRGMHSRFLVSSLPRSQPPLPPSPAPPCLPCDEGLQRAAPHSSSGQDRERYFLLVVDDYTRYTSVFPLRSKGEVHDVLIPWIHAVCLQLREQFRTDLLVLRLHSDRCGEFSSDLLRDFCRGEGILQSFTLPASPQQNGIAERRIGLVMEVARTSMIHAAASHFMWPFAVRYAAQQLNLWPRVSLPETSPTQRWAGKVGDASVFWVWGVSQVDPLPGTVPAKVAIDSGAARGASLERTEPGGTLSAGGPPGALSWREPLSPLQLREWFARRTCLRSGVAGGSGAAGLGGARTGGNGAAGAGGAAGFGAGGTGAGAAGGTGAAGAGGAARVGARGTRARARGTGAGATGGSGATGPRGARTGGTGAARAGVAAGVGVGDPGAGDPGMWTLHVNWPCGHLLILGMCGDFVIHTELALLFLTSLSEGLGFESQCVHFGHPSAGGC